MNFEWRVLGVSFASFALIGLAATLAIPVLHRRLVRSTGIAAERARRLTRLRLFPASVAATVALFVMISFLLFEPRRSDETVGVMIPALAVLGFVLIASACWRGLRMAVATRRLIRSWKNRTETSLSIDGVSVPIQAVESEFPIVAVVGIWRPRLVMARSVLATCTNDELRAIIAHEQGHVDRGDNLRRALMCAAPDVLGWLPASARLFSEWRQAAEETADDDASRMDAAARLNLASALVKVARLASGQPLHSLAPASAFYCGEHLDRRIRRLLDPDDRTVAAPAARTARTWVALGGALTASALALEGLYALTEMTIRTLP